MTAHAHGGANIASTSSRNSAALPNYRGIPLFTRELIRLEKKLVGNFGNPLGAVRLSAVQMHRGAILIDLDRGLHAAFLSASRLIASDLCL